MMKRFPVRFRHVVPASGESVRTRSLSCLIGLVAALACSSPSFAQQASDPLSRFLDGVFKRGNADRPQAPEEEPPRQPARVEPAPRAATQPAVRAKIQPQAGSTATSPPTLPRQVESEKRLVKPVAVEKPRPNSTPASPKPAIADQAKANPPAAALKPVPAERSKADVAAVRVPTVSVPVSQTVPNSPAAALERVNAYFNGIDRLTAYFVQNSANGQRAEGTLSIKRPGQLHFAYSPPSSLEIVSDGRSVAVRDKKLGTNDVYSIRQTPLKFLVQEQVDLAKDTKVRDVQVSPDGIITVQFEDSATFGGTSKITLRFDARANALKQWTILDAQGYETTVILSDLNVVKRTSADAVN
jgi:outer membrane lipoprotein-sorting protein